ncbi:MAG TPA: CocE/NonD family hydrolase [Rhodanobacteraceae bacterium]|nr:CocE/NonD family hydrolase [Rhodanobacteraceae bacterium]
MRLDDAFRSTVDEIENVFISLADGCRIAARVWLPKDADRVRVPAILEFIPYRKRDFMRSRDEALHRYVAAHGYAVIRADVRGTGDSDGVLVDEYTPREQLDACELIAWIAAQPWCTGAVGMFGISWGGFNALQVAARRPPALKAIMSLCASDDRYADDAHYMGGCLLNENMQWGAVLMLEAALPPDPAIVGPRWRDLWRQRIATVAAFPTRWMQHPARDAYWRQGSVCENYAAIQCPVYAIGGWADGYSNAVPRLLANLAVPCKGLVGPWPHAFPHDAVPGPSIGFLQEAVRWWDQWLKGRDTGIMAEPRYRVWMQEPVAPRPQPRSWPGRWVAEPAWPSANIEPRTWFLARDRLSPTATAADVVAISSPQTVGLCAGDWCGFGADGDLPRDQRLDDGGSLRFDSTRLDARIELLGAPVLELEVCADQPWAALCARLCDVAPDDTSTRISYGLLNLAYRDSRSAPTPMPPGTWVPIRLQLNDLASAIPAGHRLRLALSTGYWPIAWPSPRPVRLSVRTGASRLTLPVRALRASDAALRAFGPPEAAPIDAAIPVGEPSVTRNVTLDLAHDELVSLLDAGGELAEPPLAHLPAIGLELGTGYTRRYRIRASDPLTASTEIEQSAVLRRTGWQIRVTCATRLTATVDSFRFTGMLVAFEGDRELATRRWAIDIPRGGV